MKRPHKRKAHMCPRPSQLRRVAPPDPPKANSPCVDTQMMYVGSHLLPPVAQPYSCLPAPPAPTPARARTHTCMHASLLAAWHASSGPLSAARMGSRHQALVVVHGWGIDAGADAGVTRRPGYFKPPLPPTRAAPPRPAAATVATTCGR